jgi:hypothetical protein
MTCELCGLRPHECLCGGALYRRYGPIDWAPPSPSQLALIKEALSQGPDTRSIEQWARDLARDITAEPEE